MLNDEDIAKLEPGRVILAEFFDSSKKYLAGPHWAVVINSADNIQKNDVVQVVVISHNASVDPPNSVPVPKMLGLDGFVICSWHDSVHFNGIKAIGRKMFGAVLSRVVALAEKSLEDKTRG